LCRQVQGFDENFEFWKAVNRKKLSRWITVHGIVITENKSDLGWKISVRANGKQFQDFSIRNVAFFGQSTRT
jgi:hypothetical protein